MKTKSATTQRKILSTTQQCLAVIFACLMLILPGCSCGGMSQSSMKARAISRYNPDDEEPDQPRNPAPPATPAKTPEPATPAQPATTAQATPPATAANAGSTTRPPAATPASPPAVAGTPAPQDNPPAAAAKREIITDPVKRRQATIDRLTAIGQAIEKHVAAKREYPSRAIMYGRTPVLSWRVALLPYLGYEDLYKKFRLNESWDSTHNKKLLAEMPVEYQSPARNDYRTNYVSPDFDNALLAGRPRRYDSVDSGKSNVILAVEVDDENAVPWTSPTDKRVTRGIALDGLGALHEGSFFAVWGDGNVTTIKTSVKDDDLLQAYSAENGSVTQLHISKPASAELQVASNTTSPTGPGPQPGTPGGDLLNPGATTTAVNTGPGGFDEGPTQFAATGYAAEATRSYAAHDTAAAIDQLYADMILAGDTRWSNEYLPYWKWVPGLKRPAPTVHFGVSVVVSMPRTMAAAGSKSLAAVGENNTAAWPENSASNSKALQMLTGEVGGWVLTQIEKKRDEGEWNSVLSILQAPPAGATGTSASGFGSLNISTPAQPVGRVPHAIAPGVTYLGVGGETRTRQIAEKLGVDVIITYHVNIRPSRKNLINTTEIKVLDVASRKEIFQSKSYSNVEVHLARLDPLKDDPLRELLPPLREKLVEMYSAQPLPSALKTSHVRARAAKLAEQHQKDKELSPLKTMAELRFYASKGMIAPVEYQEYVEKVIGTEKSKKLFSGNTELQQSVLNEWLPQEEF